MDANPSPTPRDEKSGTDPYSIQQPYPQRGYAPPAQSQPAVSPFADEASPYRDQDSPSTNTPVYAAQTQARQGTNGMRRRGEYEDGVDMQVGYAS